MLRGSSVCEGPNGSRSSQCTPKTAVVPPPTPTPRAPSPQDAVRHKATASLAEQSLGAARAEARQAKAVWTNPLQHPLVRGFTGRA